ncbi:MAG: hypothetical protein ACPG19_02140 [Saprospiraceae bacterium]
MKNIILILIFSVFSMAFQTSTQPISDNETYHVMATSGLKMRATPSGKKLLTIPYNGKIEKINDGKSYGELTITELKDFKIKGEWVKVRYDGQEGFVFSGFLTQFPMPDLNMKMDWAKYKSVFEAYLAQFFRPKGGKFNKSYYTLNKKQECGYSVEYEEGHFFRYEGCNEISGQYDIEIEGITLVEAYFIIKALDLNDIKKAKSKPVELYKYDALRKIITEDPGGAGCWLSAKQRKRNSVIIDMTCGC